MKIFKLITAFLFTVSFIYSQSGGVLYLSSEMLNESNNKYVSGKDLDGYWRFSSKPLDPANIDLSFMRDSLFSSFDKDVAKWKGYGWFVIQIKAEDFLKGKVIGMRIWHSGASRIYFDGKKIAEFGNPSKESSSETRFNAQGVPFGVFINNDSLHTLAVEYSNFISSAELNNFAELATKPGFRIIVSDLDNSLHSINENELYKTIDIVYLGLIFSLLMFSFIFYFSNRTPRALFLFFFLAFYLIISLIPVLHWLLGIFGATRLVNIIYVYSISLSLVSLFAFLFLNHNQKFTIFFYIVSIIGFFSPLSVIFFGHEEISKSIMLGSISLFSLLIIWEFLRIYQKKESGHVLMLTACCFFFMYIIASILFYGLNLETYGSPLELRALIKILAIAFLSTLTFSSVKNFSKEVFSLRKQITEDRENFDKLLVKERELKKKEIASRMLEAENFRKEKEFEDAQHLQVSMLPDEFPTVDGIHVSAYMKVSKHVGGAFYDFTLLPDKTLNLVVADSTAQGLKSGTMVATVKSLFSAHSYRVNITDIMKEISNTLSSMKELPFQLGITLLKINGQIVKISSAGMPAILVFKEKLMEVDQVIFTNPMLGNENQQPFKKQNVILENKDSMLVMNPGMLELVNSKNEKINYARILETFRSSAHLTVKEIVADLAALVRIWSEGKDVEDDVAFMVVKFYGDEITQEE